jgi:hypothetical protein
MQLDAPIQVLAGRFASQPLAFAHLLDAAERDGLSPDLDHVEVVPPDRPARLRHYLHGASVDGLIAAAGGDLLILVLPGALVTGCFRADARLRDLGRHPGRITRAPE